MPADRQEPAESGAALVGLTNRRLLLVAVLSNGLGGVAVFLFGILAPGTPERGDYLQVTIMNVTTLVIFMLVAFASGLRWGNALWQPIERWLLEERPATEEEQDLLLRLPARNTLISVKIWLGAAIVFTVVNTTYSIELGGSALAVTLLGGTSCCAIGYLLAERATRPLVARALAGTAPPRSRGPSVALRLTMAWTLVTGVPLLGIAGILLADLAGVDMDPLVTGGMLFLAITALGAGLFATLTAARAVADPVRTVQEAMASVEQGQFDTRVPVDDGSEVGQLQAGFNRMATGLAEREHLRDLFGRHVGRDVAHAALDGEIRLGGEVRDVAVLFVDLVGSTALAARRPPTEVVALLNSFFQLVVDAAERHGGWVNKFEGDAALCVFGAPTELADSAAAALAAARELRERLASELPELDAGIGVSAGPAVAGNIGAEERFEYTVIGDPVNEAARLCELAKKRPERVLASDAALERAGDEEGRRWSLGDAVELRGRAAPTRLATVAGGG
jgi:adenylate cyclase